MKYKINPWLVLIADLLVLMITNSFNSQFGKLRTGSNHAESPVNLFFSDLTNMSDNSITIELHKDTVNTGYNSTPFTKDDTDGLVFDELRVVMISDGPDIYYEVKILAIPAS